MVTLLDTAVSTAKNDHFDTGQILKTTGREEDTFKIHSCLSNSIMQLTFRTITEDLVGGGPSTSYTSLSHHKTLQPTEYRDPQADTLPTSGKVVITRLE